MKKYVLTGGPGVGKTAVLSELSKRGFPVVHEAARQIIKAELARQKEDRFYDPIVPLTHLSAFQLLTVAKVLENERKAKGDVVYLDRGLADGIGYCNAGGVPVPAGLDLLVRRADYRTVFFLERLPSYLNDPVRREDELQSIKIHEALREVYRRVGLPVVYVPAASIADRVELILKESK
jgi:predicted ATPase